MRGGLPVLFLAPNFCVGHAGVFPQGARTASIVTRSGGFVSRRRYEAVVGVRLQLRTLVETHKKRTRLKHPLISRGKP
jgi:hypothetical protein